MKVSLAAYLNDHFPGESGLSNFFKWHGHFLQCSVFSTAVPGSFFLHPLLDSNRKCGPSCPSSYHISDTSTELDILLLIIFTGK